MSTPIFTNARFEQTPLYFKEPFKRGERGFEMSQSGLKSFASNPKRWQEGYVSPESVAKDWGRLVDCAFLTPELFGERFAVRPATYPPDNKPWSGNSTWCKNWKQAEEALGREVIAFEDRDLAGVAVAALKADPYVTALMAGARTQVEIRAEHHDKQTGLVIPFKSLLDIVPAAEPWGPFSDCLADLKTGQSAFSGPFKKKVFDFGWDLQAATYLHLFNAATGEERSSFIHVVQENFPPYAVGRKELSQDFIALGEMKLRRALRRYCDCLFTDTWPGPDDSRPRSEQPREGWSLIAPESWMIQQAVDTPELTLPPEEETTPEEEPSDLIP